MLSTMCLILSVLLLSATVSEAQVLRTGSQCPDLVKFQNSFDTHEFSGTWYEMIRTKRWVGTEIECVTHSLQMNSMYNISYETFSYSPGLQKQLYESGDVMVSIAKYGDGGQDIVCFSIPEYGTMSELVLLDTDYTSFAVLWSCAPADEDLHFENTMIWTRDRVPMAGALARGLWALDDNNLSRNYLGYTKHRYCPEFTPREPDQDFTTITSANTMPVTMSPPSMDTMVPKSNTTDTSSAATTVAAPSQAPSVNSSLPQSTAAPNAPTTMAPR
ncbi:Hypothetical predicted protein [Cloeon dipterum]|uniref:Lipocalin/cytosolic fatty-acid binding domain-containing protein n=2 Tax=Cloeon dipterum TaxID=197152 RepID=A0A8S1DU06_9INSE|nr:Hypothetical predicted protein [Cloeon dipterum]